MAVSGSKADPVVMAFLSCCCWPLWGLGLTKNSCSSLLQVGASGGTTYMAQLFSLTATVTLRVPALSTLALFGVWGQLLSRAAGMWWSSVTLLLGKHIDTHLPQACLKLR